MEKKRFHKSPLFFRIYADFEDDIEKYISSLGKKTTNVYKQNPVFIGYLLESEMEDVSQSGYHNTHLGYNNADWFVNKGMKLEKKMAVYFEKTRKKSL